MQFDIKQMQASPRYQRLLQKIINMNPSQNRVIDTALADSSFADENMRDYIQSLRIAADRKTREQKIRLGRRAARTAKREGEIATGLGLANIGLAAGIGASRLKTHGVLAKHYLDLTKQYKI